MPELQEEMVQGFNECLKLLNVIARQQEIQLRILCGADTRNLWKQRFLEAERLAGEALAAKVEDTKAYKEDAETAEILGRGFVEADLVESKQRGNDLGE